MGWINDPHGLVQIDGVYHLFYQHHPFSGKWGTMHWGHATSNDLIHWKTLPEALAPSEDYDGWDGGGIFTGSAVNNDGELTLFIRAALRTDKYNVWRLRKTVSTLTNTMEIQLLPTHQKALTSMISVIPKYGNTKVSGTWLPVLLMGLAT